MGEMFWEQRAGEPDHKKYPSLNGCLPVPYIVLQDGSMFIIQGRRRGVWQRDCICLQPNSLLVGPGAGSRQGFGSRCIHRGHLHFDARGCWRDSQWCGKRGWSNWCRQENRSSWPRNQGRTCWFRETQSAAAGPLPVPLSLLVRSLRSKTQSIIKVCKIAFYSNKFTRSIVSIQL